MRSGFTDPSTYVLVAVAVILAYMTAWSLFGLQRIIAWEAPLMGWHFVSVLASLALPLVAGWLVMLVHSD